MSELIIGVIGALVIALIVPWFVMRKAKDAEAYSMWQERFFQKLDSLIDNPHTPQRMIEIGLFFGAHMRDSKLLRTFVWQILTGGLRTAKGPKKDGALSDQDIPERVLLDFALLFVAWIHALSHMSVIHGILFRNLMFPFFRKKNGDDEAVEEAVVRPYAEAAIKVSKATFPGGMVAA